MNIFSFSRPLFVCAMLSWVLMSGVAVFADPPGREVMNLDGAWSFQLDPGGLGEKEQWFLPGHTFQDTIQVPGAWDAQGFGEETDKLHHNYIGKGWYRKTLNLPTPWQGRPLALCFGGVYRSASVWVNGKKVGAHIGYASNFELDLTDAAKGNGTLDIVVQVDSEQRWEEDALQGCMDIIDGMYTSWGGIWSHVSLESRASAHLCDLYIAPRTSPTGCTLSASIQGDTGRVARVRAEVMDAKGQVVVAKEQPLEKDGGIAVALDIPKARLWTPETPYLYTARLTLLDGTKAAIDEIKDRFGVRSIEVRGTDFYVNGSKYYLNGYGDDCVYPDTIAPPPDKQFYVDRLRVAKSYGFNYVRHHSHFVAPEYYEACDEVGMFVSPELQIGYPIFYTRALKSAPAMTLYRNEWTALLKRYRNHASIFDWCMCNEVWEGMTELAPDLYKIAKQLDPTRPVIDSDGLFMPGFIDGTKDRPTLDFFTVMFDIVTSPIDNPTKFNTGKPLKPIVTHEEGNFVHFPLFDQIEKYKVFKPFWLTDAQARVAKAGLLEEAPAWSLASQRLYLALHKSNIEALRKNPYLSGYDWWLLQPWYAGSNGLLDGVRRPVSIRPEEVRAFNAPTVILQDGIAQTYPAGATMNANLSISNYAGKSLKGGTVTCRLSSGGKTLATRKMSLNNVENGTLTTVGTVTFPLPCPAEPQQLALSATLHTAGVHSANEWTCWVYPQNPPALAATPVYASPDTIGLFSSCAPNPMPENGVLPAGAVYVARQPSEALLNAAEAGSCVVLLSPAGVFPMDMTSYKSAWWLGVFSGDSNAGTYVYDNPVTKGLTPGNWCDPSWFHLLQGAQTLLLDNLPEQPEVLIRALNTHGSPAGMSRHADFDYVWRNKSLLTQVKVGRGSMILSGLNFDAALRTGGPEASFVLARLINHAQSLPTSKAEWSTAFLRDQIAQSPFCKGPLVNGFKKLVAHRGETGPAQSYRAREVETLRVRQSEARHRLQWESAPMPAAEVATLVFAGTLSFQIPGANNSGYMLNVNGKTEIQFDNVKTQTQWKSDDGKATLLYVPANAVPSWSASAGLFYLALPKASFVPGEACQLEIHPRGSDDKRSMGLQPYDDIISIPAQPTNTAVCPVPRERDWWLPKHESLNKVVQAGNVDLLWIGDSIIENWDDQGKTVWEQYYGKRKAANLGVGGDRTEHVLWRLDHGNLEGISPKLTIVMIGQNNCSSNSAEEIAAGITAVVQRVRTRLPESKILLLAIFPLGEKPSANREKLAKASGLAAKLADGKQVFYMDVNPSFLQADGTLPASVMPDFEHPSTAGHEIWAKAIEAKVAELLGESATKK